MNTKRWSVFVMLGAGIATLTPNIRANEFRLQPDKSAIELVQNPFGEAWANQTSPNPDVPVAFSSCQTDATLSNEEAAFLSGVNHPVIMFDQCPALGAPGSEKYTVMAGQIRALNPGAKVLAYYSITKSNQGGGSLVFQEDWYVHQNGQPTTPENRIVHLEAPYLMDVTNPEFQDFVARTVAQQLTQYGLDGFLNDWSGFDQPPCLCDVNTDIPPAISAAWQSGMTELFRKIRTAIGPDRLHIYNTFHIGGDAHLANLGYHQALLEHSDGVIFENANQSYEKDLSVQSPSPSPNFYRQLESLLNMAQTTGRSVYFMFNSGHYGAFGNTSITQQQVLERYYLAFYLNFFRGSGTPMLYYTPIEQSAVFLGKAYFADWNLRIGQPLEPAEEIAPGVFRRPFTRGEVWLNSSDSPYEVRLGSPLVTADGNATTREILPSRSGMLFVQPAVLAPMNPSFESVWNWQPTASATAVTVSEVSPYNGRRSIRINSGFASSPGLEQPFTYLPNRTYRWSARVRTVNNGNPSVLAIRAPAGATSVGIPSSTQADGSVVFMPAFLPSGTHPWQFVTFQFRTSSGGNGALYAAVNGVSQGEVFFDDVTVTEQQRWKMGDYTGDGMADPAVFKPSLGSWNISGIPAIPWGNALDIPVPGDYDGDGVTDYAVYRPSEGFWYVRSPVSGLPWGEAFGNSEDIPVPGDYNGDGKTDFAVFRPANGTWYAKDILITQWGNALDIPVPGDYDGDGKTDLAVFRPSDGTWNILQSATSSPTGWAWGNSSDIPVPGDYDGDGKTDLAVYRPSGATFYIHNLVTGAETAVPMGEPGDVPASADFDGDGKTDIAVWRPSDGYWYIFAYGARGPWGVSGDIPVVNSVTTVIHAMGLVRLAPSFERCDLDQNGSTSVLDVQQCANQAIALVGCTNGDINLDSSCNVVDVQRVVNSALGGPCVSP